MTASYRKSLPLFWSLVRPEWPLGVSIFLANLVAALLEGSTLALLAGALQKLAQNNQPFFLWLVLAAVSAQIFKSLFQFSGTVLTAKLEANVHARTYSQIFSRILSLPYERVSRYRLGDLTDYLGQSDHLSDLFLQANLLLRNGLMVISYGILLCWLSLPMTLIAFAGYVVVSRLLRRVIRAVSEHSSQFTNSVLTLSQKSTEYLQGIRAIHTFARQKETSSEIESLVRSGVSSREKAAFWSAAIEPVLDILTVIGMAVLLISGALILGRGDASRLPHLLAILLALYRMTPRLGAIHASLTLLASRKPNLRRIADILQEPVHPDTESSSKKQFTGFQSAIAFRNVTLRYLTSEAAALKDLSFTVPKGSFTALVGISGAGKSSVANLILRLYDPSEGALEVDDADLRGVDLRSWRDRLGVVLQEPFLFHTTIRENIAYAKPAASMDEIRSAARAAHADGFISQLEHGYDSIIGERGFRLSGGQRQRIALARALVKQPEILLLDEATSALDSESERLIQDALDAQRGVRTVLAIAHRLSTVCRADQILVLDQGRLAEKGTHAELLQQNGIYVRLWRLQSEELPETAGVTA